MRRNRNDGMQSRRGPQTGARVWHNPEMGGPTGRTGQASAREERATQKEHRAALEALFAPKKDDADTGAGGDGMRAKADTTSTPGRANGKIVLSPPPQTDPRATERQRLLAKLLGAAGRPAISKATNDFLKAGFTLPDEQEAHLQLLEHADEDRVREGIDSLSRLLAGELPKRPRVLESRLRRIEEFAEEAATRQAAERLRRQVFRGAAGGPRQG